MKKRKLFLWLFPGLITLILDRIVKILTVGVKRPLIPGVLGLNSQKNMGMALGIAMPVPVVLLMTAGLGLLCFFAFRKMRISGLGAASLSMLAGGALGNLIDRVFYGYVFDMLELLFMHFYIFNVADVGVVAGAILCGISLIFRPQDWSNR